MMGRRCNRLARVGLIAFVLVPCATALELRADMVRFGRVIATGNFGSVREAQLSGGTRAVAKSAAPGDARAAEYLAVEETINALLHERAPTYSNVDHAKVVAPFIGGVDKDGCRYLLWHAAGEETLDSFLSDEGRRPELARALGCKVADIPRRVLHDLLQCLAHAHACGIAHRDVKPENVLVDASAQRLRLIDFGSACDCAGWLARPGSRPDRVPCSVLFMPPEQRIDLARGPYAYDIYSAGLVWLCAAVPALAASEDALFDWRLSVREHRHDLVAWRALRAAPPCDGWAAAFGWSPPTDGVIGADGRHAAAWELLTELLAYDPGQRPSAAEALLGRYLNIDCAESEVPVPAARPWTLDALVSRGATLQADECQVRSW